MMNRSLSKAVCATELRANGCENRMWMKKRCHPASNVCWFDVNLSIEVGICNLSGEINVYSVSF